MKKLTAIPSEPPIRVKAIQWVEAPIFLPNNMSIIKDSNGKNKLSKASVAE